MLAARRTEFALALACTRLSEREPDGDALRSDVRDIADVVPLHCALLHVDSDSTGDGRDAQEQRNQLTLQLTPCVSALRRASTSLMVCEGNPVLTALVSIPSLSGREG